MEDFSQFAPVSDSLESFDQFAKVEDSSKLPELPPVPADTQSDYSFVGFANPTTLPKAQKAAEQVMAEQEPGYFSNAFNYAAGEEQSDPNFLGKVWKGASQSPLYEHPFETLAGIGAGILTPMSWGPLGQMVLSGGAVGLGNVADQALVDESTDRTFKERATEAGMSGLGAGLFSGLGYGLAKGMQNYASPYIKAVKDYAAKKETVQAFKDWLQSIPAQRATDEVTMLRMLGSEKDNLRFPKIKELLDAGASGDDILDLIRNNKTVSDAVLEEVTSKMQELPKYRVFGPSDPMKYSTIEDYLAKGLGTKAATPTTGEVGQYVLENLQEPIAPTAQLIPESFKEFVARRMPGYAFMSNLPPVSKIASGLAGFEAKAAPVVMQGADYLAPAVARGLGSAGGVGGGILGSEATRSIQDELVPMRGLPPIF